MARIIRYAIPERIAADSLQELYPGLPGDTYRILEGIASAQNSLRGYLVNIIEQGGGTDVENELRQGNFRKGLAAIRRKVTDAKIAGLDENPIAKNAEKYLWEHESLPYGYELPGQNQKHF